MKYSLKSTGQEVFPLYGLMVPHRGLRPSTRVVRPFTQFEGHTQRKHGIHAEVIDVSDENLVVNP